MTGKELLIARSRLCRLKLRVETQQLRDSIMRAGRIAILGKLAWSLLGYARHRK